MRIVLDLQSLQTASNRRGIGRYCRELARSIAQNRGDHELLIVLSGLFPEFPTHVSAVQHLFRDLLPASAIRVWPGPQLDVANTTVNTLDEFFAALRHREQLHAEFIASLQPDIVLLTSFFEGSIDQATMGISCSTINAPICVIQYDLIPLLNAKVHLDPNPFYKMWYLGKIEQLKNAAGWFGISQSSCQEGIKHLQLPPARVFNIAAAADPSFRPINISSQEKQQLMRKFSIVRPFFLCVGSPDPHKNQAILIEAFARLPTSARQTYQLVLATGSSFNAGGAFAAHAIQHGLKQDEVVFTGYVTDQELIQLYNLCHVCVVPSLHEGFGLTALEAMQCGAPVIGANSTSIPEVIGDSRALFDPTDADSICGKLLETIEDEPFRLTLIEHGMRLAQDYSWEATGVKALAALEKVAAIWKSN